MVRGRVSYALHAAIELVTAVALLVVPFAIGMSTNAAITAAVLGAALFGLAISATGDDGRGTLPVSAHAAYDAAVALVLVGSAVIFGLSGEPTALAFLLAAGTAQLTLNTLTRYSPTRA
jgi:hypothetical protein